MMPFLFNPVAVVAATPTLLAHISANPGGTGGTSGAINTTGATFLVVAGSCQGTQLSGVVTDSKSNTWVFQRYGAGTDVDVYIAVCYSPIVGSGHTFTYTTGVATFPSFEVMAFNNIVTSAFNQSAGTSGTSSTIQAGSVTPSVAKTLIIATVAINNNGGGSVSIDSSYSITDSVAFSGGLYYGSSSAYKVLSSASAQNPTWNLTNSSTGLSAGIASFAF